MKTLPRNKEYIESNKRQLLEWLDVDTEIELINNKQSKLSANHRRMVIEKVRQKEAASGE